MEENVELAEFMQEHWLSVLMGAYLAGMALYGHRRGFLRLAVSMASCILSLGAVRVAMPPLTAMLKENTGIHQWVRDAVEDAIGLEDLTGNIRLPAEQRAVIEETPLPESIKRVLVENNNEEIYQLLGIHGFVDYIGTFIADRIINTLAFIVLFLVLNVGLHSLSRFLNIIARLPVLYGLNQLAGAALGILMALLYFWIFCLALNIAVGTDWGKYLLDSIEAVPWVSWLYYHNALSQFFFRMVWNLL